MYSGEGANGRNPAIEQMLKLMSPVGLSPSEAVEKHICSMCGNSCDPDKDLRDSLSIREWYISAMCQTCQDLTFLQGDVE